ncbi:response regulator [Mucilaginibacter sp.]|jgi:DNA-binding NarL/FixJ family response regulator|uniref:response regulator n=1 Tax=Mucilaginibacter sp. TaxID=1882438 RepID=UPI00356616E1
MQKLYVYIVEDNPLTAFALRHIITTIGHHICGVAECYDKAVKDLHVLKADLVITDIMIKGSETGIDLARYINDHLHIPFIFQSSVTSIEKIRLANLTSPSAFLSKPVSRRAIVNALKMIPVQY